MGSRAAFASAPDQPIWRVSVKRYHEMIEAGILTAQDRVELLDGVIFRKMPKHPPHSFVTGTIRDAIVPLPAGWHDRMEQPITLLTSEPEPDLAIVRGRRGDYRERHPGPADVALLVEVACSSQNRDRGTKKRLYARAKIPVYWIADIDNRRFEIYRNPDGKGSYRNVEIIGVGDRVSVELRGRIARTVALTGILNPD